MTEAAIQRGRFFTSENQPSNFTFEELMCKCCSQAIVDQSLIDALQGTRNIIGELIYILSGFRCPKHNMEVGGASMSRHMMGLAADWKVRGLSIWETAMVAIQFFPRVIIYPHQFLHTDMDASKGHGIIMVGKETRSLVSHIKLNRFLDEAMQSIFGRFPN